MDYRGLGDTDIRVSAIGLGCARIGGVFQANKQEQLRLLHASFDSGITLYDTADMYAQGGSERLLGEAFRRRRDKVIIATKAGYLFASQSRLISRMKPLLKPLVAPLRMRRGQLPSFAQLAPSAQDFSASYLVASVEGSLRRLGTDYLDIFQLHSPPREVLERGDFVTTLDHMQAQGKIRCWGIACETADDALVAVGQVRARSVQISLSLLHRESLEQAIPAAAAQHVGVIARQAFASGLLTRGVGLHANGMDQSRVDAIRELEREAAARAVALPEFALAFVLQQPGVSAALVGMHRESHLQEVLGYLQRSSVS